MVNEFELIFPFLWLAGLGFGDLELVRAMCLVGETREVCFWLGTLQKQCHVGYTPFRRYCFPLRLGSDAVQYSWESCCRVLGGLRQTLRRRWPISTCEGANCLWMLKSHGTISDHLILSADIINYMPSKL